MSKRLLLILSLILPLTLNAQEFINNPDYLWGEGRGATLEEADKKALEGLITSLNVDVGVNTSLNMNDHNGQINKEYDSNIKTRSSINLRGVRQYIDNTFTDGYRVYRYFNAVEYVEKKKQRVKEYLELADKGYSGTAYAGTINLTLGYCYLAYQELNDDVMTYLDNLNEVEKAKILHRIKAIIGKIEVCYRPASLYDYDWSDIRNEPTRPSYDPNHLYVSAYYGSPLMHRFDFEYWDGVKWSNNYKWNNNGDIAEIKCTSMIPRNIKILRYRVPFQVLNENGEKVTLSVPDDFYIVNVVEYVDPLRWIEDDKKRGWY